MPEGTHMQLALYVAGTSWTYGEIRSVWRAAEAGGVDHIWMHDNVTAHGWMAPDAGYWDTWALLPALAEATNTIRFGTLVSPVGRRAPALLAKSSATIDALSDGRFELGLGPGDDAHQFRPWGMPFGDGPERVRRLAEEATIIRRLWTEPSVDHDGEFWTLRNAATSVGLLAMLVMYCLYWASM